MLVDNQKAAVLVHHHDTLHFNPRFLDVAAHYGFTPRACRPYRARTKGKDERMVGYIKHHFFVRYRAFESWAHLNQLAEGWLREEADLRAHGTVHEVVAVRFEREQPSLAALPAQRYDTSYLEHRHVSWDSYLEVRGNRYSVPDHLVGRTLRIRIGLDERLRIFDGDDLIVTYRLRPAHEGWVTLPEHHQQLWHSATAQVEQRPLSVYDEVTTWS